MLESGIFLAIGNVMRDVARYVTFFDEKVPLPTGIEDFVRV